MFNQQFFEKSLPVLGRTRLLSLPSLVKEGVRVLIKLPSLVKEGQGWFVPIVFLFLLFFTACENNKETSTGSLSFGLQWNNNRGLRTMAAGDSPQIDCAASGVATVEAKILDTEGNSIASGGPWDCNAHSGIVSGIPEGDNRVADILGKNNSGAIIYTGKKPGLTIKKGEITKAGTIEMVEQFPTPTPEPTSTAEPTPTPTSTTSSPTGEGTVTIAGLTWQKEDDDKGRKNWAEAIGYCTDLSLGGYSDWRLPSIDELKLIIDNTRINPTINTTDFPNTDSSFYWSATTYTSGSGLAWVVDFSVSGVGGVNKTSTNYVRCVR